MKITGPIMARAVISGVPLLHAQDSAGFFSLASPSWETDSLKWWINQTFRWLVFFCGYKPPGQVLFDYSGNVGAGWWRRGCIVIDCTALHADDDEEGLKKCE